LCLFTCLLLRAVHLEVAFGLDTDSLLNASYRLVNRRGLLLEVVLDNGGNFVVVDKELCELVKRLDEDKIHGSMANQGIVAFQPSLSASLFGGGGVHETMIEAAKNNLRHPGNGFHWRRGIDKF